MCVKEPQREVHKQASDPAKEHSMQLYRLQYSRLAVPLYSDYFMTHIMSIVPYVVALVSSGSTIKFSNAHYEFQQTKLKQTSSNKRLLTVMKSFSKLVQEHGDLLED